MSDEKELMHALQENKCDLSDGMTTGDFECADCKRQICVCFWAEGLADGVSAICCDCYCKREGL